MDSINEVPSRPVFFIPNEDRQVEPQQQQLLLAPSVSSSTGRKRKLQNKEDGDNIVHHQVTSPRKVYTNKRRRLNQQQQSNGDINSSISSGNCTKRQIPSSAISVDIQKTTAGASPKESRVENNISNDVVCIAGPIKAATASVLLHPRLVIQQQSKAVPLRPGSDATATASKKNKSRGETSSDEERFLGAFEKKLTYSKAELGRETKLSAGRINHLIVKYCDKVSPESSQSKVYLKPEFRVGNTQHSVVWFSTPIPTTATVVFVHQLPATFILPPMPLGSSAAAGESQTKPSATVRSTENDVCVLSSPAVDGSTTRAMKNSSRKIACKQPANNDEDSRIGNLIGNKWISSSAPPAKKKTCFNTHRTSSPASDFDATTSNNLVSVTVPTSTSSNRLFIDMPMIDDLFTAAEPVDNILTNNQSSAKLDDLMLSDTFNEWFNAPAVVHGPMNTSDQMESLMTGNQESISTVAPPLSADYVYDIGCLIGSFASGITVDAVQHHDHQALSNNNGNNDLTAERLYQTLSSYHLESPLSPIFLFNNINHQGLADHSPYSATSSHVSRPFTGSRLKEVETLRQQAKRQRQQQRCIKPLDSCTELLLHDELIARPKQNGSTHLSCNNSEPSSSSSSAESSIIRPWDTGDVQDLVLECDTKFFYLFARSSH